MIDREQIEKDIRAEVEGTSVSNEYVVYLTNDSGTSLVTFKGDLDAGIKNFLSQIDDNGMVIDTTYTHANIGSVEEFAAISSHVS
jgi:hypothetical protein